MNQTDLIFIGKPESVAGVVFSEDRTSVLLTQRRDVPVWVLPGGGIDPRESPEAAIVREILEETGFTVKVTRLIGHYTPCNRLTRPTHLYECTLLSGTATPSNETLAVAFFPLTGLPQLVPPPYQEWIADGLVPAPPIQRALHSVNYKTLFFYFLSHPILVFRFILARIGYPINF